VDPRRRPHLLACLALGAGLVALLVGAVGCSSSEPTSTGTTTGTLGETTDTEEAVLAAGMAAAKLIDPHGEAGDQEWLCLGVELQRDPALGEAATKSLDQSDVGTRKNLLRLFADCVGPDALVDIYVDAHQITADRRDCVKQLLLAESLDDQIASVAGDGDAGDVFAKRVASQCSASASTTAPAATSATPG
jgi:hypothetical protein